MASEYVRLAVAGFAYESWTQAAVGYGAKQAAPAFAVTVTDATDDWGDKWNFMPGTECSLTANGDLIVTGIIDKMTPSFDASNHTVNITGRSKSKDTIDSAAEHETGEMRNMTPLQIAQALDKQGVGFTSSAQMDKVPLFRINPGETVFEAVERVCRKQELMLMGTPQGGIEIAAGETKRVHPALQEGDGFMLGGSATLDESDQHSEYKVRGQKVYGTDKGSLQVDVTTKNSNVSRHRPKHVIPESDIDEDSGSKRGKNHRNKQQAKGITASIKTQGWHDQNGKLWVPNTLITIISAKLKLQMDLLLNDVHLTYGPQGSFSQLNFVQPSANGSSASTGSKTDAVWQNQNQDV